MNITDRDQACSLTCRTSKVTCPRSTASFSFTRQHSEPAAAACQVDRLVRHRLSCNLYVGFAPIFLRPSTTGSRPHSSLTEMRPRTGRWPRRPPSQSHKRRQRAARQIAKTIRPTYPRSHLIPTVRGEIRTWPCMPDARSTKVGSLYPPAISPRPNAKITRLRRVTLQSVKNGPPQLGCILSLSAPCVDRVFLLRSHQFEERITRSDCSTIVYINLDYDAIVTCWNMKVSRPQKSPS
jgi:hypothetical protein